MTVRPEKILEAPETKQVLRDLLVRAIPDRIGEADDLVTSITSQGPGVVSAFIREGAVRATAVQDLGIGDLIPDLTWAVAAVFPGLFWRLC